jgi:Rap guanine nucleotide exchange factor 2
VILVTELRGALDGGARRGHVVIRGTPDRLMLQLIEENSITDPTYVEDFLLTHRTFVDNSLFVATQLLDWFEQAQVRDRVARVVLLWVNNHFTDFETDPAMMEFLEAFEACLEREKMQGQQRYAPSPPPTHYSYLVYIGHGVFECGILKEGTTSLPLPLKVFKRLEL